MRPRRCHWCGRLAGWHHTRLGMDACGQCSELHWQGVTLTALPEGAPADDRLPDGYRPDDPCPVTPPCPHPAGEHDDEDRCWHSVEPADPALRVPADPNDPPCWCGWGDVGA